MTKSATDVMQDIVFSAVIDAIGALKAASKGVPNTLLRDLNAVHANTTLADLPPELQAAIATNVRSAFTRLLKEGYSVSPGRPEPMRSPPPRRDGPDRPPRRDGPPQHRRPSGKPGGANPGGPNAGRPNSGNPRDDSRPPRPPRPPKPRG
jgi:hypothetical protein